MIFLVAFSCNVFAEIVNKVDVKGNERISLETIIIFGDIEIGKDYNEFDVGQLIKKLYDTKFFSNLAAEIINNKLTITVKENPIVDSIIFKGEKTEKFQEKIRDFLNIREKSSFVSTEIQNDINLIKSFYKQTGFYFVKIDAEIVKLEKNRINIVYIIDRGEKAKISKIYFLGDKKFRSTKLRDIIASEESKFWKFLSRNVYLNQGRIELDKRLLKNYYRNKGYYEVDIATTSVEYSEGEGFVLSFNINSGKRYKFNKIYANISDSLDSDAFLGLEIEFNKLVGKYYSQTDLNSILEKIDSLSERKELQFINHSVSETLDDDTVEVKINIFEGQKFIIEKVNIAGNTVTNDSVIRSQMLVDEGDPYSVLLVNKSINKLRGRNIFASVSQKTLPGSTADQKILEINVEEKATGEIMAGAGVGTDGGQVMFSIRENNWLGKGVKLSTDISLSEERIKGGLSLTNPNYNFTGNSVFTSLDLTSTDKTETSGYKSDKRGFNLGTTFEQYEGIFLSPSLEILHENIETDSTASEQLKKQDGNYFNTDFTYGVTLDKRNLTFNPTDGYQVSFFQSIPLVQDKSSLRNAFYASGYNEVSENVITSLKGEVKTIHGIDDDVRLSERMYVSQRKLRGFANGKVGPKDGTDWVGGNYVTSLSAEAQLPNLLPEAYKTDFSVFLDTANVWGVDYNSSLDDSNKIRSSIGLAANLFTPVGPLSWTLSQAITKTSTDETEMFNFNLGTSF